MEKRGRERWAMERKACLAWLRKNLHGDVGPSHEPLISPFYSLFFGSTQFCIPKPTCNNW